MLDEKGRIFGKISVIDICIVFIIFVGVFYVVKGRSGPVVASAPAAEAFTIKYKVEAVPEYAGLAIENGDRLEDDIKGGVLGTITELTVGEGYDVNPDINGVIQKSLKEGYVSLDITSEVNGQSYENGVIINGNPYSVGQNVTMRAGKGKVYVLLYSIEPKGGQ